MKAVYSFWEDNRQKVNGGFRTKKELAISLALSVELSKSQFDEIELVTNSYGKKILIDKYKIPFDSVKVVLDQFDDNLNPDFWAYVKLYAYSIQDRPFVHIDNDVYIWEKIPHNLLQADLLFQNKEQLKTHTSYLPLINIAKNFPRVNLDMLSAAPDFAYNCGIVGANNLDIIKQWKEIVDEYLFHPKNQSTWATVKDKHSQNHLFEQFFISALIKAQKMEDKVEALLSDDFYTSAVKEFKFTHLWGETKRKPDVMQRVKKRLYEDYPHFVENFEQTQSHGEIFEDIYRNELWGKGQGSGGGSSPEITFEYRRFLQNFLKEKKIKHVIDLGCGDWQFSRLINWDGIQYLGLDCVETIIKNNKKEFEEDNIRFAVSDFSSKVPGSADLLIVKDVLIHWTNDEILAFFDKLKQSKNFGYVLITNQTDPENINKDISTGEFHNIDINKAPFNFNAKEIFRWPNDSKTTYLIDLN